MEIRCNVGADFVTDAQSRLIPFRTLLKVRTILLSSDSPRKGIGEIEIMFQGDSTEKWDPYAIFSTVSVVDAQVWCNNDRVAPNTTPELVPNRSPDT